MAQNMRKYHYSSSSFGGRFTGTLGNNFVLCFFVLCFFFSDLITHPKDFRVGD